VKSFVECVVIVLIYAAVCFAAVCSMGCQVDVSGSVGGKMYYPDKLGGKDKDVGDPRRPMYEGSGYVERHLAGGQSDYKSGEHFRGLKEEK
jgi:hypothetical protein